MIEGTSGIEVCRRLRRDSGTAQVPIIAWLSPFIRLIMFLTYPVAKPLSRLLDYVVGKKASPPPEEATSPKLHSCEVAQRGHLGAPWREPASWNEASMYSPSDLLD